MTFIEWLKLNYSYTGDGSTESIQAEYSAAEIDHLYQEYSDNTKECI